MKHGVPTCSDPVLGKLCIRCMYHEFWWGPFDDEAALTKAILHLDEVEPLWDYDCFTIDGLSMDVEVIHAMRERIEKQRKDPKERMDEAVRRQNERKVTT